jgi:hypothetical protein
VDKAMNKEKSKEILLEISELRDSMHKLFDGKQKGYRRSPARLYTIRSENQQLLQAFEWKKH